MSRFDVVPGQSEVLVRASTSVATVTMKTNEVVGHLDVEMTGRGAFLAVTAPSSRIELAVATLHSGNPLFDTEGRRRFDATHYPRIQATLAAAIPLGNGRHRVRWQLTFHGTTRDLVGDLVARALDPDSLAVEAEQRFDVRHWGVEPGSVLAIRVRPEATFAVRLIARRRVGGRSVAL